MEAEEGKEGESSKRAVGGRNRGKLRNNAQILRSRKRTKEGKLRKKGREPGGSQKHDKLLSYSLWRLKDINTCTDVRYLKPLKPLLSVTLSRKRKNSLRASSPIWANGASLARTHHEAAKLRGDPRFCLSSRVPLVRLLFLISPKWRACSQASERKALLAGGGPSAAHRNRRLEGRSAVILSQHAFAANFQDGGQR